MIGQMIAVLRRRWVITVVLLKDCFRGCATRVAVTTISSEASSTTACDKGETAQSAAAIQHMRGSSLLLVGRFFAYGLEFAAQVLLVRYLTKSDFGAFSYALSIVVLLEGIAVLELPNTLARLVERLLIAFEEGNGIGRVARALRVCA